MTTWDSVRASWRLLKKRDHRILFGICGVQAFLAILDLVGVLLLGLVAALSAASLTDQVPSLIEPIWNRLDRFSRDPASTLLLFALLAALILVTKSVLAFLLNRKIFRFLAARQAVVATNLATQVLNRPLIEIQQRTSQELTYALTTGVSAATLGVLGSIMIIFSEGFLITIFIIGLLFVDPIVTVLALLFFGSIAFGLHRFIGGWASRMGLTLASSSVNSLTAVQDVLRTYREVLVSGRRVHFLDKFSALRWQTSRVDGDLQILNQISKYVFEIALIVGGGLLAAVQIKLHDATAAISIIAIFLLAASRVMPSLLRLQQAALVISTQIGVARPTLSLANDLKNAEVVDSYGNALSEEMRDQVAKRLIVGFPDFSGSLLIEGLTFTYLGAVSPAISAVSIKVPAGSSLAIVGPTGSGKSTLADLLLGVLLPDEGRVLIDGLDPLQAISVAPGAVAYVPQEIVIVAGSVRDNVALGLPEEIVSDERIWEALERAQLAALLRDDRDGLDTVVGEHGLQLSGGQRQRLGLARALFTRPKLIVLDEATSALDTETEHAIGKTLSTLEGNVTLVIVAHRLSTIRDCDQVCYIENGKVLALGSFDEVRELAPNFDYQAELSGL